MTQRDDDKLELAMITKAFDMRKDKLTLDLAKGKINFTQYNAQILKMEKLVEMLHLEYIVKYRIVDKSRTIEVNDIHPDDLSNIIYN